MFPRQTVRNKTAAVSAENAQWDTYMIDFEARLKLTEHAFYPGGGGGDALTVKLIPPKYSILDVGHESIRK